jgi:hypothetical protein
MYTALTLGYATASTDDGNHQRLLRAETLYAYFNGCSEGGREGLMEAQRFPEDFNGILAGAPGVWAAANPPPGPSPRPASSFAA